MKDTVIIGIGNILLQDDGVGVHVITQLENETLPSTIEFSRWRHFHPCRK
ncbi:hypothetical protein JCM17380_07370 [Desulfosporosinus burensis]